MAKFPLAFAEKRPNTSMAIQFSKAAPPSRANALANVRRFFFAMEAQVGR
jgi:hypothetical protein